MTDQAKLLEILQTEYRDEVKDVIQMTYHAQYMYYPHFRERLLRIAAEEEVHVRWFAEKIRELGGELPHVAFSPTLGKNSWECLRMNLVEEKQDRQDMQQRMREVERLAPEIAQELRRICAKERKHYEEILDMMLKSSPEAVFDLTERNPEYQRQKQIWLEQEKIAWVDKRKREWATRGKVTPWADWRGLCEHNWRVNELPNRELRWALHVLAQEGARRLPVASEGSASSVEW
ncbi:MAG: ferritin-like domain-containing protein [Candidatus Binatia bacterium]